MRALPSLPLLCRFALLWSALGWPVLTAATPAASDAPESAGVLEEITVTARKTVEPLQSVPASISVLSANDLTASGISDFTDIISHVPNVYMGGGIAGVLQGQLGIRGVSTLVRNIGVESGVGIYVDGVYMGRSDNYNQELIDIGQIEVLRGPQGTLFGKNTIAGVFNITTLQPQGNTLSGMVKAEGGDYGLLRTQAYLMGPIVDGVLSGKIVAGYLYREGTYNNLSGGEDGDALNLQSYRTALYYTPAENTKIILAADGLKDRGRPAFFQATDEAGPPNAMASTPHTIDNNRPDHLYRDNYGVSLTGTVDFGSTTFTSISAYRHSAYRAALDDDQSQEDFVAADRWGDITNFFTQELRLNGKVGDRFSYVGGVYYFNQKITTNRLITLGTDLGIPGEPDLTTQGAAFTKTYAAYGNADYKIGAATLSAGVRVSREIKDANFVQGDPSGFYGMIGLPALAYSNGVTNDDVSPTASLSYQVTPDVMTYARYAKGFKSASFNVDLVPSTSGLFAGPEHATTYEVGLKSDWFGRRLRGNLALFDTKYDDMQVSQLLGGGVTLNNAGKATIKGYELELTGYATRNLKLEGSLGYLDAVYDKYASCGIPNSLGGGQTVCSGNRVIGAPKYSIQAGAEYDQPVGIGVLVARLDYNVQSPVFFEATNSPRFESNWRHVLDARLGLTGKWEVFIWGKNLTNATYITYRDDRSATGVFQTTAYGDPRTYGVSAAVHF